MSLIRVYPHLLGQNYWDVFDWPQRLVHQNFGLDLPQLRQEVSQKMGFSEVINDKNKFEIRLDCNHFKPEELVVKTIGDSVVIQGKHEERDDSNGNDKSYISREFSRRYTLPVGCDAKDVVSSLDSNGVLKISVKKQKLPEVEDEKRDVPIAVTNASDDTAVEDKNSNPFVMYLKHYNNGRPRIAAFFIAPKPALTYSQ